MREEEITIGEVEQIAKILGTEGFANILNWIEKRVDTLKKRIVNSETDISVQNVSKSKSGKVEITVVNINKDYEKHEIKVWELFKKKVEDWGKVAEEQRK